MSLHQRAKDLFLDALARPPADRAAFVAEVAADDPALRTELESLLAFHEEHTNEEDVLPAPPVARSFEPGEVFAGRYRMISRLGRGGMGDVWRAEDLVLQTGVALKLIHATVGADARERILNEVRLARQITHPSVCRVFDVGEADGLVFYSMELVRGEDLAALLRRAGRLPSDKVADIARQLCAGLTAAHSQNVLHRDLKPANILIDDQGLVRITDFGIAIPRRDAALHKLTGTPGYMAPEQRAQGTVLSERTDVYALGLVLYELLTGRHPYQSPPSTMTPGNKTGAGIDPERPPLPSTLVPNVDPQLERVVMQAIAIDPLNRPASAFQMAAHLPDIGTRRNGEFMPAAAHVRTGARPWLIGAAVVAAGVVIAVVLSYLPGAAGALNEQDTIVLSDFDNATGEAVFDGTLKVALAVSLEQSPFLKVFPDERAQETLRLMQRSPDERITRTLARDIARRERLKALIAGSVASLGRNYVLTLEAINAETGDVMAREQAEAEGKEQVLTALGNATSRLREKLGESLASVQRFDMLLPRATTASLDALHAYSLSLSNGAEVPRLEAIPHLERAIEIDPSFAMALAFLSSVYANNNQTAMAPAFSRRAFELRDRVSERERFFISWRYYRDAVQAWDEALEVANSWAATYPRDANAFNAIGVANIRLGRFAESVKPLREAIRLDPRFTPAYANLSATHLALSQFDEARAVLKDAADRRLEFAGARRLSYLLAFVQNDPGTMARELAGATAPGEVNTAFGWQGHAAAFGGRARLAHEQFAQGAELSLQGKFNEAAARLTMEDAENHAVMGQCNPAGRETTMALALSRDNITLERATRVFALCGGTTELQNLTAELTKQFPDALLTTRVALPVAQAAAALERGQPARAIEILEPVRPYDHAPSGEFWPPYVRGQAYLQAKDGGNAATEFQSILDRRGEVPASVFYPLAYLGLARAAVLTNDMARARTSYDAFFSLWKDADPDLPTLLEARREYARLAAGEDIERTGTR